jgi:nucleoside phosphorylase
MVSSTVWPDPGDRVSVMTALPDEFEAVEHVLGLEAQTGPRPLRVSVGTLTGTKKRTIVLVGPEEYADPRLANKFNPNTAAQYARLLAECEPDICLYVGVASGVDERVRIGDVVFGNAIIAYDVGEVMPHSKILVDRAGPNMAYVTPSSGLLMPDGLRLELNSKLCGFASRRTAQSDWYGLARRPDGGAPKAVRGAIASGEKVIKTRSCREYNVFANMDRNCLAVDMESYGFAQAVRVSFDHDVQALVIRGISDLIEGKEGSKNQDVAAHHAALFARAVLEAY